MNQIWALPSRSLHYDLLDFHDLLLYSALISNDTFEYYSSLKNKAKHWGPGQVAQLVGASSCIPKCHVFDPWSGRIQESTDLCFSLKSMFLFLSPSPSL